MGELVLVGVDEQTTTRWQATTLGEPPQCREGGNYLFHIAGARDENYINKNVNLLNTTQFKVVQKLGRLKFRN